MADTAYSFSIATATQRERAGEAIAGVGAHLVYWLQAYNIRLRSIIVDDVALTVTFTFSDPVPKVERDHIRISLA